MQSSVQEVRVRFAPSPTGLLHLGGLRTALYNYLFARKHQGTLILRVEDTDQSRQVQGAADHLLETLTWAGLAPDEGFGVGGAAGPYLQSQRLEMYHEAVGALLAAGFAYRSNYSSEEMEHYRSLASNGDGQTVFKRQRAAEILGEPMVQTRDASGSVVRLDTEAVAEKLRKSNASALTDDGMLTVADAVKGAVSFPLSGVDDCVLLKSDSFPTYHLANVVDDTSMRISHVIRGEEWLSSSPRHLLLYAAFDTPPPTFAHLPLLLNPAGGKLSKRHAHGSVEALRDRGYEPQAVLSFVSLMGFTPSAELLPLSQLAQEFDLKQMHSASVKINLSKLEHLQSSFLRTSVQNPTPELLAKVMAEVREALSPACLDDDAAARVLDADFHRRVLRVVHERIAFRADVAQSHLYFWEAPPADVLASNQKLAGNTQLLSALARLSSQLAGAEAASFDRAAAKAAIEASRSDGGRDAEGAKGETSRGKGGEGKKQVGKGPIMKALRIIVTGSEGGPELLDVLELLGPSQISQRITAALRHTQPPATSSAEREAGDQGESAGSGTP